MVCLKNTARKDDGAWALGSHPEEVGGVGGEEKMPSTREVLAPSLTGVGTTIEPRTLMGSGGDAAAAAVVVGAGKPMRNVVGSSSREEAVFGKHRAPQATTLAIPLNAHTGATDENAEGTSENEKLQQLTDFEDITFNSPVGKWNGNDADTLLESAVNASAKTEQAKIVATMGERSTSSKSRGKGTSGSSRRASRTSTAAVSARDASAVESRGDNVAGGTGAPSIDDEMQIRGGDVSASAPLYDGSLALVDPTDASGAEDDPRLLDGVVHKKGSLPMLGDSKETGVDGIMKELIEEVSVTLFTRRKQNYAFVSSIAADQPPSVAAAAAAKAIHGAEAAAGTKDGMGSEHDMAGGGGGHGPKRLHRSVSVLATHTGVRDADRFRTPEARLAAFHSSRKNFDKTHPPGRNGIKAATVHIGPVLSSIAAQTQYPQDDALTGFWPRSGVAGSEPEMTWVKKLIRYVEMKPLFAALGADVATVVGQDATIAKPTWLDEDASVPKSQGAGDTNEDVEVLPGPGGNQGHTARVTVFPSRRGNNASGRASAVMLETWLGDMLHEMKVPVSALDSTSAAGSDANAKAKRKNKTKTKTKKAENGDDDAAGGEHNDDEKTADAVHRLSESALWLFRCAFEEVRRQVANSCRERAAVLKKLWESFFSLVEVRTMLKYEDQVEFMRSRMQQLEEETAQAMQRHDDVLLLLDSTREEHKHVVSVMEHSKAKMIRECRSADKRMKEMEERMARNEKKVLEEVDLRCRKEEEVMLLRRDLELSQTNAAEMEDKVFKERERAVEAERRCAELHYLATEKTASVTAAEEEIRSLKESLEELKGQKKQLKGDLDTMRKHATREEQKVAEERSANAELRKALSDAAVEKEALEEEMRSMKRLVSEQSVEIAAQKDSKTQLDMLYAATKTKLEKNENRMVRLETSLDTLRSEHERDESTLKLAKIQLREQLEHCLGNLRAAEVREKALRSEIDEAEPELEAIRVMVKRLGEVLDVVDDEGAFSDPATLERQWKETGSNGKCQRLLRACLGKYGELAKSRTRAENQKIVLKQHVEGKQKDIERIEHKLFQEKCRNEKLQRSLDASEAKVAELTRDGSVVKTDNQQLKDKLSDTIEKFELMKQEVRGLRIQGANEEKLQKEMHAIHDVLQKTKNKLENEKAQRIDLTSQVATLTKDLDHMGNQARDLTASNTSLNAKVKSLGTQVFDQANEIDTMKREMEDTAKRNQRSTTQLTKSLQTTQKELANTSELLRESIGARKRLDEVFQKTLQALSVSRYVIRGLQSNAGGGQSLHFPQEIEDVFKCIIVPKEMLPDVVKMPRRRSSVAIQALRQMHGHGDGHDPEVAEVELPDGPVNLGSLLSDDPPASLFRISMAMLAASNRRLREQLVKQVAEHEQDLKTLGEQMAALGAEYLECLEREKEHVRITRSETQLKAEILKGATENLNALAANQNEIVRRLNIWEGNFRSRKSIGLQVNDASMALWLDYVNKLPRSMQNAGNVPLDRKKVIKLIVQIHLKRLELFSTKSTGSHGRVTTADTIFENIRLTFRQIYGNYENSPAERSMASFLTCCRVYQDDTKIITFAKFAGLVPGNDVLNSESYNFYTECLECLKRLLGVNWRAAIHDWEQGAVVLPLPFVCDLLCNLYNTNDPTSLLIFKQKFVPSLNHTAHGEGMDLDTLLSILLKENVAGHTPVQPMLSPRRALRFGSASETSKSQKQANIQQFEFENMSQYV